MPTWMTDWTADEPLHIDYGLAAMADGTWEQGPRAPYESRDLGLAVATDGKMGARHLRRASGTTVSGQWQHHEIDFQWLFVTHGSLTVENEDGETVTLEAGDSAYLPPYWRHRESDVSADFQALEVVAPATYETRVGEDAAKADRAGEFADQRPVFNYDRPESYVRGDGPRSYFEYRDLGLREPTDQRLHIHIVRSATDEPMEGGTGDHHHTMSQWFMPIAGWADIEVEGQGGRRMYPGDLMCIAAGMSHNVPAYSVDYATLEMCVPAEYDTVND